jgi:hypothetical protein
LDQAFDAELTKRAENGCGSPVVKFFNVIAGAGDDLSGESDVLIGRAAQTSGGSVFIELFNSVSWINK